MDYMYMYMYVHTCIYPTSGIWTPCESNGWHYLVYTLKSHSHFLSASPCKDSISTLVHVPTFYPIFYVKTATILVHVLTFLLLHAYNIEIACALAVCNFSDGASSLVRVVERLRHLSNQFLWHRRHNSIS